MSIPGGSESPGILKIRFVFIESHKLFDQGIESPRIIFVDVKFNA